MSPKFQLEPPGSRQMDRLPCAPSLVRAAAGDERCGRSPGDLCTVCSWLRGSKRDRGVSSEAPMPSRVSGRNGRICWQAGRPQSQWGCVHSSGVQFEPCDVRDACCLAKDNAQRQTKLALCLEPVQGSVASVSLSSHFAQSHQKAMRLPQTSRPCRTTCKAGFSSEAHVHWRRSSERIREWRQQKRNTPRFSTAADQEEAAGRPCLGAAHSTHPSRVPWSYHCGAQDESAEGSG